MSIGRAWAPGSVSGVSDADGFMSEIPDPGVPGRVDDPREQAPKADGRTAPPPRVRDPRATVRDPRAGKAHRTLLDVRVPRPVQSVLSNGWPMIVVILAVAYLFALFFPTLGALLLIGAPLAILGAFVAAVVRVRQIRLSITDEVVRVSSGKAGTACERSEVHTAVLVDQLKHRTFGPRTTDLILMNQAGRSALLLSGSLWPPSVLARAIELLEPLPVERVTGKQNGASLTARYPKILQNADGSRRAGS